MNKGSLLFIIAAGLFAAAAGVMVGQDGAFSYPAAGLLIAAVAMAVAAVRTRGPA